MTPEKKQEARRIHAEQVSKVIDLVGRQVRRDTDALHARRLWHRLFEDIPGDAIVEGLVFALSSGRYQEVPPCHCCNGLSGLSVSPVSVQG